MTADPIALWLAANPSSPAALQAAGLFATAADYTAIARRKAAIVEQTGLLGLASVWGGQQLVFRHFLSFGSAEQQAAWQGRGLAVAISEPDVGAHPKRLTTRAAATQDGFHITGRKAWVSNGPSAEAIIVFAITSEDAGRKRYSAFIVPRETAGLTIADMPGFHALRPSRHCLLTLDCHVPATSILGLPGTAYERMALPFRDIEDAVGTFAILGALRHARHQRETAESRADDPIPVGEIVALTEVFAAAATAVVATLDAGELRNGDAVVAGLRVLALDIVARLRPLLPPDTPIITDLDAVLAIARGPRMARLARLAATAT
jgi:acyl-CoA dehydrogenase